jgi:protein TonB
MMFFSSNINSYALKKDNYISISMDIIELPKKKKDKSVITPIKKTQPKVVEEETEIDIGDLFSNVKTQKIKKKPKKKQHRIKELQNRPKDAKSTLNKDSEKDTQTKESSSGNEVNEYLAKIQALVYKYFEPPANSQGHSVKAVIVLSAIGKVIDFRILTYSNNQALNNECDNIKSRLKSVLFPINPENKKGKYTVILTSKE